MTNKELEKTIKRELKKKSKDTIIELYLQMKFERDILQEKKEIGEQEPELPHETKYGKGVHNFQVGDRVQFKSWEEMEKEYGLDSRAEQATIKTNPRFLYSMTYLCGTYATIKEIQENGVVKLKDFSTGYNNDLFSFSLDMLKPATAEPKCKFKVGDKVEWKPSGQPATIIKIMQDPTMFLIRLWNRVETWVYEKELQPYTEPRWTFTDDEKVILRNLPEEYKWIVRDKSGQLFVYERKPEKKLEEGIWNISVFHMNKFAFNHLFQSIKWTDEEPCEFREYL